MSYYGQLRGGGLFSRNSDLSSPEPELHLVNHTFAPNDAVYHKDVLTSSTPKTLGLTEFTTVIGFMATNKSATTGENIVVAWTDAGASQANKVTLLPGGVCVISATVTVASSIVLTAATGTPACDVLIFGT